MGTIEKTSPEMVDDKPQVINADLRKFNRSEQMVKKAVVALTAITAVASKEDCDGALVTLKEAKTVENAIEAKRKELVKPFNDAVKKINTYAKELTEKLPPAIDSVKKLVLQFQKDEEAKALVLRNDARIGQLTSLGFTQTESGFEYGSVSKVPSWFITSLDDATWVKLIEDSKAAIEQDRATQLTAKKADLEEVSFFGTDEDKTALESQITELETKPAVVVPEYTVAPGTSKVKGTTRRWTFEITDEAQVPREYLAVDEKKIREAMNSGARTIPGVRIFQEESLSIR